MDPALPAATVSLASASGLLPVLAVDAGVPGPRRGRGIVALARAVRREPAAALDLVCTPPPVGRPCEMFLALSMMC